MGQENLKKSKGSKLKQAISFKLLILKERKKIKKSKINKSKNYKDNKDDEEFFDLVCDMEIQNEIEDELFK